MINTEKYIKLCDYGFLNQSELARKCDNNVLLNVSNLREGLNKISDKTAERLTEELKEIKNKVAETIKRVERNDSKYIFYLKPQIMLLYFRQNIYYYRRANKNFTEKYKENVLDKLTFILEKLESALCQDSEVGRVQQ